MQLTSSFGCTALLFYVSTTVPHLKSDYAVEGFLSRRVDNTVHHSSIYCNIELSVPLIRPRIVLQSYIHITCIYLRIHAWYIWATVCQS